jgi:transposase-like protein
MKTTDKRRRLYTPEEKQALIKECEESGKPIKQFCREKGIETSTLYRWRRPRPETSTTHLRCPNCGCDVVAELTMLTMKLKALQQL